MPAKRPATIPRQRSTAEMLASDLQQLTVDMRWAADVPPVRLTLDAGAQRKAYEWGYKLRNRRRWADDPVAREAQAAEALAWFAEQTGVTDEAIHALARAAALEVSVPFNGEEDGWAGRVLPWEYLITAATRTLRGSRPLTITRRLARPALDDDELPAPSPATVLYVECAPHGIRDEFGFDSEWRLVQRNFADAAIEHLADPSRAELADAIARLSPDVVHVAGVDARQGLAWLAARDARKAPTLRGAPAPPPPASPTASGEGMLLRGDRGVPDIVSPRDAAALVTGGARKPMLVAFNVFNSAARLASLAVAEGAGAAVGFQDEVEDAIAEAFYASFYREWRARGWNAHRAFEDAWAALRRDADRLRGTGIVLWSAASRFDAAAADVPVQPAAKRAGARAAAPAARSAAPPPKAPVAPPAVAAVAAAAAAGAVQTPLALAMRDAVEVRPFPRLNYSMLHNNRSLFLCFRLRNDAATERSPWRVSVSVQLHTGDVSQACRLSVDVTSPTKDVGDLVRVPLVSLIGRSVRESMKTNLLIEVRDEDLGRSIHHATHQVTLLPIDEWRDDDENRHWLPSFVYPRDPAVLRVVDAAQRYLMAITDDPTAGFDGYQSFDEEDAEYPARRVDQQVQAIWSALLHELPLSYINPPPTFTDASQRLRTPSDVVTGRRGTCIDLALLLASCLEYVEIYPVLVLLNGHAFPGYWRSEAAHDRCRQVRPPTEEGADTTVQKFAWVVDRKGYDELRQYVLDGDLVLLESVHLTQRTGFWDAVAEGENNIRNRREFHSMMDVRLARENDVTPLPIAVSAGAFA